MKRSIVLLILLFGLWLRWDGIDWGLPHIFHPDETRMLYAVNDISWENLNPKFFAYGSLPIYLLKIVHVATETVAQWLGKPPYVNFFLVGRAVSAFFGSLTLLMLYLLAKRGFSERVALLSTTFLALTVLHIQLSHFLTVDVMLTFFVVAAFYFLTSLVHGQRPLRDYLLGGVCIGCALATKISALPLYGVFLLAHLFALLGWQPPLRKHSFSKNALWGLFFSTILLSGIVFFICEPYALLDYKECWRQIREQGNMVRGLWRPPYVLQYEQTIPYWYPLKQLIAYSMGLPLGLFCVFGALFLFLRTAKHVIMRHALNRDIQARLLLFAWVVPVFWIVGGFHVKFLRYMVPLIPFLCLLGALFFDELYTRFPLWKIALTTLLIGIIGFSAFYALAFVSIYQREDPRVQASRWIYEHVAPGKTLMTEEWEFAPLVAAQGHSPAEYRMLNFKSYAPDSDEKIRLIAEQLSKTDVIVLATRRMYGSIVRVADQFPRTANYYNLLFDGILGFTPVRPFTVYPSLLGVEFNDDLADESFSVYEHPKTLLFRKTRQLSADELYALMITAPPIETKGPQLKRLLTFPQREAAPVKFYETPVAEEKSDRLPAKQAQTVPSQSGMRAWLLWLLTVELLAFLTFPFSAPAFRKLPDAGYAVSKILGLLLPAYLVWLGTHLGLLTFTRSAILAMLGLLALAAFGTVLRSRRYFSEILQAKWRVFLAYEIVFLLVFSAFSLIRAYNPDIFWSESSMDFSFLTVLTRSETLPPPDPWMSGFPLNYYYFGHFLVATLTKLTGILPQVAYNLAFALWPALVSLLVFSVLYNLTRRYLYGALGTLFACFLGNIDGFLLLLDYLRKHEFAYRFFRPAHEVIPYTVHEFPFWTFIFVDLHAHLLNMPFLIATFLIGLHLLLEREQFSSVPPVAKYVEICVSILIVGTLGVISSWDYPTGVIFLILIALAKGWRMRSSRRASWKTALRPAGYVLALIVPGSLLAFTPFYASFSRQGMGLGLVGGATTQLSDFFTIFGFFLFLITAALISQARRLRSSGFSWMPVIISLAAAALLNRLLFSIFQIHYVTLLFAGLLIFISAYVFWKMEDEITPKFQRDLSAFRVSRTYICVCLIYACLIVAGCELIFVRDFLQGGQEKYLLPLFHRELTFYTGDYKRMNTIFKFYLPVWFLLSIAASYSVKIFFDRYETSYPAKLRFVALKRYFAKYMRSPWNAFVIIVGGLLFLSVAVFPIMSLYARRHQQDVYHRHYLPPTLDGLAYLTKSAPDEYAALRWLNTHVAGTPVIIEATGADYLYEYARISANSGLPTPLGWKSHADQREHWHRTYQREQDIKEMYANPNLQRTLQLLRDYHVAYVYIGATERRDFSAGQLQKFERHPQHFEQIFASGETEIYRMRQ